MTDTVTSTEQGVEVKSFEGTIENAYGRPLSKNRFKEGFTPVTSIPYSDSYEHIASYDAIPEKEMPDKDDILNVVNNARKANARQKAMQVALDAAGVIKPTLEDDDELRIATTVKGLLAAKKKDGSPLYTEERARTVARQMLGLDE